MTGIFDFKNNINYRHDVKKSDYLTLGPSAASVIYMNQSGEIRFQLSQDSSCLNIGDAEMVFTVEIQGLEVDEDLTLEHNFFPKLFSQMRLNLGGTDVEIISNPGDVSSLLSFVLYDENVKNTYGGMMGWIPDKDEGDTANSGFKRRKKTYNKKKVYRGYFEFKKYIWLDRRAHV